MSAAGLRAFFKISNRWKLTTDEQRVVLGGVSQQTLCNWKAAPADVRLTSDQLDRVSYLLGIYKALHILFQEPEQADSWIRRPNDAPPFCGKPAADLIFGDYIEDLARVRRYLDGVRDAC